jgi:VanZ family protein
MAAVRKTFSLLSLLVLYLAALALVAAWPSPVDKPANSWLRGVLGDWHHQGVPGWVNYAFVEAASNVVLFLPFGVLVGLALPRRLWWLTVPLGFAAASAIEAGQLMFLPRRVASVQDVTVNTLGALLGVLLVVAGRGVGLLIRTVRPKRARPPRPVAATPGLQRPDGLGGTDSLPQGVLGSDPGEHRAFDPRRIP